MNEETGKPVLYFLCTGNSCRSQIAEGYGRFFGQDKVDVYSAGLERHGVNPRAVIVMAEDNIDISGQSSDLIDLKILEKCDYVITLCGDANDKCPITSPNVNRLHWGLPDPAKASGTDEEILTVFREVRDEIKSRIKALLEQININ